MEEKRRPPPYLQGIMYNVGIQQQSQILRTLTATYPFNMPYIQMHTSLPTTIILAHIRQPQIIHASLITRHMHTRLPLLTQRTPQPPVLIIHLH